MWVCTILDSGEIVVILFVSDTNFPLGDLWPGQCGKLLHKLVHKNRAGIHVQRTQQQQLFPLISSSLSRLGAANQRNPLLQRTAGMTEVVLNVAGDHRGLQ